MNRNILALIDRPESAEACVTAAAALAKDANAGLLLAIDPQDQPYAPLDAHMNRLIDAVLGTGVTPSTMLVNLDDFESFVRAIRCHQVDVVVMQWSDAFCTASDRVAAALGGAQVVCVPVSTRTPQPV